MTERFKPELGRDLGRQVAEALGLADIDNIRSIQIDMEANELATVHVSRFVPTGNTAIVLAFEQYELVPNQQWQD